MIVRFNKIIPGIFALLFLGAVALLSQGCEKEDTDCIYRDKRLCDPDYVGSTGTDTIPFSADLSNYDEKVLLEEFTGFLCVNCPTATAIAVNLKDQYPERLTIVSIHCTANFAAPLTDDPDEPFYLDFRTEAGEEYVSYFQVPGLPRGVINRQGLPPSATINYPEWSDRVNELMSENNPEVYIRIGDPVVSEDSTILKADVTVKPLVLDDENYIINMGLMESGIREAQKAPGNTVIYDYEHNHVFRGNSNGTWGKLAYDGNLELADEHALRFNLIMDLDPEWNLENSEIFVYIYKESNREVIQVEELEISE